MKTLSLILSLLALSICGVTAGENASPKIYQTEGTPNAVQYGNTGDLNVGKSGANAFIKSGGYSNTGWIQFLNAGQVGSSGTTVAIGYGSGAGGAVTQATNASTGVTINNPTGQITTVALTTAAAAEEVFTVTNAMCAATDIPIVSTTYAGAGTVQVTTKKVATGAFDIVIANLHASSALNAAVVINFAIVKGVAQ